MIISHKYKCIFIKTRKTAGTSIEVYLSQHCAERDTVTPIWPHVEPHRARHYQGLWNPLPELVTKQGGGLRMTAKELMARNKFFNHMPAALVRQRVSKRVWNSYFKFCVERNPWDKTLSHFHMLNDRANGDLSFAEYMENRRFCVNMPLYTDAKGGMLVDRVVKYESLTEDLGAVFQALGIPFSGSLEVRAKSEHRKDRSRYQEMFSKEHRAIIESAFAREIEMHGYAF